MELLRWKARFAVLWIIEAFGMSVFMFLFFMEPGVIEGIISGHFGSSQISEGFLFYLAIFWFIPFILAFLSLTIKGSANRWTNFVLGILFAIFYAIDISNHAAGEEIPSVAFLITGILGIVAAALIAWHAWKLPKLEA